MNFTGYNLFYISKKRFYHLFFVFLISIILSPTVRSQNPSNELTVLDTIVRTDFEVHLNPSNEFVFTSFQNNLYFARTVELQYKSFWLYSFDTQTFALDSSLISQPRRAIVGYAGRIAISETYLVISGYESFNVFKKESAKALYKFQFQESVDKYYIPKIRGNVLQFSYCYNFYQDDDKSGFGLFNLESKKWEREIKLETKGIYFSHLTPSRYLDFHGEHVLHLDPLNYNIQLLDTAGLVLSEFCPKLNWNSLDSKVDDLLVNGSSVLGGKEVLQILNRHRKTIDRCQEIVSLNDSIFLVSYYRYDSTKSELTYYIDFYRTNRSEIRPFKLEVLDEIPDENTMLNAHYPSMHTFNPHCFVGLKLLIFRDLADISYWGKTINDLGNLEEKYFEKDEGNLGIFTFSFRL
jgi:hypothetical protein